MRRKRKTATHNQTQSYETLEPRQMLATLYLDFGLGIGATDLNMSDTFAASVNAPQIYGSQTPLMSFTERVGIDTLVSAPEPLRGPVIKRSDWKRSKSEAMPI